jgi:hypothetical protein
MGSSARGRNPVQSNRYRQYPRQPQQGKGPRTKAIPNDVPGVHHPSMPGITRVELIRGRNIQKQVAQGGLESVQGEIQNIKAEDS